MTLGFLYPALLWGFLALPIVWLLAHFLPKPPQQKIFGGTSLLVGLSAPPSQISGAPWWLKILRSAIFALLILGLSGPSLRQPNMGEAGERLLVIDNGWTSGGQFFAIQQAALVSAQQAKTISILVGLSGDQNGPTPQLFAHLSSTDAQNIIREIRPQSVPADLAAMAQKLPRPSGVGPRHTAIFFGYFDEDRGARALLTGLSNWPDKQYFLMRDKRVGITSVRAQTQGATGLLVGLAQASAGNIRLEAIDGDGRILGVGTADGASGFIGLSANALSRADHIIARPKNGVSPSGDFGAAGVFYLSNNARWPNVGIIGPRQDNGSLADESRYIRENISPFANLHFGNVADLTKANLRAIIWPDQRRLNGTERAQLGQFIRAGGVLIRFTGPTKVGSNCDDLCVFQIGPRPRYLSGAVSMGPPQTLADFDDKGLFHGLTIPSDLILTQMAAPLAPSGGGQNGNQILARLKDGTPFIVAQNQGRGQLVQTLASADPRSGNLGSHALLGQMLMRMINGLGGVPTLDVKDQSLAMGTIFSPFALLDGQGALVANGENSATGPLIYGPDMIKAANIEFPPGLYRAAQNQIGPSPLIFLPTVAPNFQFKPTLPASGFTPLKATTPYLSLGAYFLVAGFCLLLVDFALAAGLMGALGNLLAKVPFAGRKAAQLAAIVLFLFGGVALAWLLQDNRAAFAQVGGQQQGTSQQGQLGLAQNVNIAAITEDPDKVPLACFKREMAEHSDNLCSIGMAKLAGYLNARSAIVARAGFSVTADDPALPLMPLIYWKLANDDRPLSPNEATHLNQYMGMGGLVIIDISVLGRASISGGRLRHLLAGLDVPPLKNLSVQNGQTNGAQSHVLTRTFYLLRNGMPGFDPAQIWVANLGNDASENAPTENAPTENAPTENDGASPIIITSLPLAANWASLPQILPAASRDQRPNEIGPNGFPFGPDYQDFGAPESGPISENETAIRTGLNIFIYALTGNYKADAVHVPALLRRWGQEPRPEQYPSPEEGRRP